MKRLPAVAIDHQTLWVHFFLPTLIILALIIVIILGIIHAD